MTCWFCFFLDVSIDIITEPILSYFHSISFTTVDGSLLNVVGVNRLHFSIPPDPNITKNILLEIAFEVNDKFVYIDVDGPNDQSDIQKFNAFDFQAIMEYMEELVAWEVG